ncbi:MAG: cyclic nucleotide-binding domain-containing protein [Marinicella sp.]
MHENAYKTVIIGSGPAGLSAAGRAAERDQQSNASQPSYVLLEAFSSHAKTIHQYQKGKLVMAEPGFLSLRSPLDFKANKRERVLQLWQKGINDLNINIQYDAEVTAITGTFPEFSVSLKNGQIIQAENIILSIGLQGNPRKLGLPNDAESEFVQYTLDDPLAYQDKTFVVVGAGDAAIENAMGLTTQNEVHIINRRNEFSRAKEGNLNAILSAINSKEVALTCHYNSHVKEINLPQSDGEFGHIVLDTPEGLTTIECHGIIARLGAIAPRKFVESCGVKFPNDKPSSIPDLSNHYESNVKGLYIIGALGGYPLIKQAMNQGYDVIEFIHGNEIKPADHPLLEQQFSLLPYVMDAQDILDMYQQRVPMFRRMNALSFRELVIESNIVIAYDQAEFQDAEDQLRQLTVSSFDKCTQLVKAGDFIFKQGDYSNSFYTIVEGEVTLRTPNNEEFTLTAGQFFGEMSLLSGRPRSAAAIANNDCILIETPRRIMLKLMNSNEDVEQGINLVFIKRALQATFKTKLSNSALSHIASAVKLEQFNAGEFLFNESEIGKDLFLIRSGTVAQTKGQGASQQVASQIQPGQLVGQLALMGTPVRQYSAQATVRVEAIRINKEQFISLVSSNTEHIKHLQSELSTSLKKSSSLASFVEAGQTVNFLLNQGLGEATNALIIDEDLCIGCDNCEKACAETHAGISRLDRVTGASFAGLHVPISCRHCEQPHCMKDCPADSIHRAPSGEVFIDETCIGCGNCETNCPYDVIKMSYEAPKKPGLLAWMLWGAGTGPGEPESFQADNKSIEKGKKAVKCDACIDQKGGAACVRSCPTGAAIRVSPNDFIKVVQGR